MEENQKFKFIEKLLDISSKEEYSEKTRERLNGLIGKELEKTGDTVIKISKDVKEIKDALVKSQQPDRSKSTKELYSHNPKSTVEFLRLFKFVDGSGFKELVHDTDFNTFGPETILDKVSKHPNFIYEFHKKRIVGFKPIHRSVQKETIKLIRLFKDVGMKYIETTGDHPFEQDKEYTDFVKIFKKGYRYGSGKEYTKLRDQILTLSKSNKYHDSFSFEKIIFKPNNRSFDVRSNFFTWTNSIRLGIQFIFDGIKDHSNILGKPYDLTEKVIEIECWKSKEEKAIYLSILDKDSNANDPNDILVDYANSTAYEHYFRSLCDWSIEADFQGTSYRINILTEGNSNNESDTPIQMKSKVGGYKHILKFYDIRAK